MGEKTRVDSSSIKLELINKKVKEINERRRGMKITAIEDELDRQELRNYIRIMGVEPGNVKLESIEDEMAPRDQIFYATLIVEGLIELSILFYVASILLKPELLTADWASIALLAAIFGYLGYRIYKDTRVK